MAIPVATPASQVSLSVEVIGADLYGRQFFERTQTLTIHRNGVSILLANDLAPDTEVILRNPETNAETVAAVVGSTAAKGGGRIFGLAFTDPAAELWAIPFLAEEVATTMPLACSGCHAGRAYSLTGIELEMFEATKELTHRCNSCKSSTIWREAQGEAHPQRTGAPLQPGPSTAAIASPMEERRKNKRTAMKMSACIRFSGTDITGACEDISKGGFRFVTSKEYPEGTRIEASVPFVKFSKNIFSPAFITYCHKMPDGKFRHGAAFIKTSGPIDWGR